MKGISYIVEFTSMPKCICQICQCGKHRCPHYMPQQASKPKGPCQYSEYQTMYKKNQGHNRDPIRRPEDLLRNEGEVDFKTTHKDKFPAHQVQKRRGRVQENYIRNTAPMDLNTEYGSKYVEGKGEHFPYPDYLKQKSQPFGDGKDRVGQSTTHQDFHPMQPEEKAMVYRLQDNVHLSEDPFDHQTTHQSDFTRLQKLPEKSQRRADQLDSKGPGSYQTTNKEHFIQHKNNRRYQKPATVVYYPNQRPFEGKSMMKSDFQPHSNVDKSEMVRHENNLFSSNGPLDNETTNHATYKGWEVQKRPVINDAPTYKKPQGKMDFNKTSDDYKMHGNVAKKTMRPRDNLEWTDKEFDGVTSYKDGYIRYDGHKPEKSMAREREYYSSGVPFEAVSENKDQYKKLNVSPSKPVKRDHTGLLDNEVPFVSGTSYELQFGEKKLPECPSKTLLSNNFAGYKIRDDFVAGHRYLVADSRLNSPNTQAPLPPIGQQRQPNQRYVAVQ